MVRCIHTSHCRITTEKDLERENVRGEGKERENVCVREKMVL